MTDSTDDAKREMLRHTLATLAYRGGKTLRGAPEGFASFRVNETTRTPAEILAHVGDLLDWAHNMARGRNEGRNSPPCRGRKRSRASSPSWRSSTPPWPPTRRWPRPP